VTPSSAIARASSSGSYFGASWTVAPDISVDISTIEKPTMCDMGSTP
jgi:hypothetical protein